MKLRNKKTGEIIDLEQWRFEYYKGSGCIAITNDKNQNEEFDYGTFADMKDEWEDYKPKEPLIEDEKIRKAVRAWAEVNSIGNARYTEMPDRILCVLTDTDDNDYDIHFVGHIPTLEDGEDYTIAELCGEEEE